MPYPLPLTRTEAYLAYKAGVIQQSDLKPSLSVPRNGIDAWLAYWTGLAEDYPKREDGTPHVLQEEEAYIAYLSGVINEYPEKCLRRVGAYLRYLISARWGRPDHPLNREELYLSLLKTQVIPSGDPSSDIEIDGTAKAAFQDLKVYGDTLQDSYTGKNLLEIRPSDNSRGLTIVNNARTGELTFSGTTTQGYPWLNESFLDLPAGTYTFSIDKPVGKTLFLRLYNEDGEYPVTLQFTAGNTSDTKTTDYAIKRTVLLYGETTSGATVAKQTIKPMLEAGSTKTTFEPYTGAKDSPSVEFPQDIYNVSGQQNVVVTGKNMYRTLHAMLKAKEAGKTISTTRCTIVEMNDNKLVTDASGADAFIGIDNLTTINPNSREYGINVEGGQKYTLSYDADGYTQYIARAFNESNTQIAEWSNVNTGNAPGHYKYTFTMAANAAWLGIRFDNESARHSEVRASISNIMVEKGDDETSYEPYIERSNTVELRGKNLFDIDNLIVGYVASTDGSIVEREDTRTCPMFRVTPGKKYISSGQPHGFNVIAFYDYNKNFISRPNSFPAATAPDNAYWGRSTCIETDINTVQLEEGNVATSYEKHWHIELNKLGDDQDYIYKQDGIWKIHKVTDKEYLYNCNYYMNPAGETGRYRVWNDSLREIIKRTVDASDLTSARCDSYQAKTQAQTYGGQKGFDVNTNGYVQFYDVDYDGSDKKDSFVAMLKEKSAFIVFALATATDTTITNQALIDQLEALVAGGAENGTTYIKVLAADPNLPGLLVVEAPKYE